MILTRILLFPFALLYGCIVAIRNFLYDKKIYGSISYDFPVICIGNLTAGGTGKSPHVEYLIKLLQRNSLNPATLSRGYKRKTTGFLMADKSATAASIGDEPLQFFTKFNEQVPVAVAENRMLGIAELLANAPDTNVVLLDDAFQHRSVQAGFNILITRFDKLFTEDYLMPDGLLREFRSGAKRAQAIVVSKCPDTISENKRLEIQKKIAHYSAAPVFFSKIKYAEIKSLFGNGKFDSKKETIFISGIADHKVPEKYLQTIVPKVSTVSFADHHNFDITDLEMIFRTVEKQNRKWNEFNLITTEKDAMRLLPFRFWFEEKKLNLHVLPIEIEFLKNNQSSFDSLILDFIRIFPNG